MNIHPGPLCDGDNLLLTDLYEVAMVDAYLDHGMNGTASFELFVRTLPNQRNFLIAAGLEQAVAFLETARFAPDDLAWLRDHARLSNRTVDYLGDFRFSGDVDALPEGTAFFAHEPILRVTASLPEAQMMETRLINLIHLQTVIASKAARLVLAADGRPLFDFGLRRAHGAEAGLLAARAAYIAGFAGTAIALAGRRFGIPIVGTMAHSFVQAHRQEADAFINFARSRPRNLTLLLDTYDTEAAAGTVVSLAGKLAVDGVHPSAVRLDSGDLATQSQRVRAILDAGGLSGTHIVASGGLDEYALGSLLTANAPIDSFGIGTSLTTSSDAPALDCAYKLVEYAGLPRRKRSPGKATWPGRKQVFRSYDAGGRIRTDLLSVAEAQEPGRPLLIPVMRNGRRVGAPPDLTAIRSHAAAELASLPEPVRDLTHHATIESVISPDLEALAEQADSIGQVRPDHP
ncbi:nicotinate phosphoribosyltransferase [Azospirillum sp. TSA2s]|uniref:nicotinate phosphoribosyltransferase n=1 Tax=Azospirillum sp. TSA2s TaxID=709810 RepID=UPI0010A99980|nr:nicotinate phosphoribosyltransferase [Azospirillum sp. TSA2s]QCG95874.1 nicotinate phosphoribosyltransferase [Azospirillum sp. TSA2s]